MLEFKVLKTPFLILTSTMLMCLGSIVSAGEINLAMHQSNSGSFYVHAEIDTGIETDLLLDTGSGYVSLSKQTFDRIAKSGKPKFSRHIYGTMANGKVEKIPLYFVRELKLADNCVLKEIEVAVFPKADRDILGLNALSKLQPFTIELTPASLTSDSCSS